ncbi:hypothetical protein [Flavobacterium bizetiae]|uniref:hypothetical protein n=1 Tax=Flavobacterium bizetiae TaxID=2704140 RepID=UPI0037568B60
MTNFMKNFVKVSNFDKVQRKTIPNLVILSEVEGLQSKLPIFIELFSRTSSEVSSNIIKLRKNPMEQFY